MAISTFPAPSAAGGAAKILKQDFITQTGTYTVPAGVTKADIVLVGGGGGAGGSAFVGSGGGSGSVLPLFNVALTPGSAHAVTIGAGGAGGAPNTNGSDGGTTSFGSLTCEGGRGGNRTDSQQIIVGGIRGRNKGGSSTAVNRHSNNGYAAGLASFGFDFFGKGGGSLHNQNLEVVGDGDANTGNGGDAVAKNGGSGIIVIKYWSEG